MDRFTRAVAFPDAACDRTMTPDGPRVELTGMPVDSDKFVHAAVFAVLAFLAMSATGAESPLVLRYYLDQSEAEIADTLEVSRGSVKRHASRGLAALAHCLEAGS